MPLKNTKSLHHNQNSCFRGIFYFEGEKTVEEFFVIFYGAFLINMIPFKNPLKIFTFSNLVFVNDENGEEFYAKTQLIHG